MNRRRPLLWLLVLLPALLAAAPARAAILGAADRAELARIVTYLNGLTTLKARFLQVAPDGSLATGTAWLERPGKMRFQYDPPSPLLLVAGHGLFVYYDASLGQTTNLPLFSTPLSILLASKIRLNHSVTVTGLTRRPGQVQVTLERTADPGSGNLTLVFADPPLTLRQWRVVDAQHRETIVTLYNVELGGHFQQNLFTFIDPNFFEKP